MTWHRFWELGEVFFDRFFTATITLYILKMGGYIQIGWTPIVATWFISFAGGILCAVFAALCEPERDAETMAAR